jgi:L-glyceraldehyde 3-phosphate reductase
MLFSWRGQAGFVTWTLITRACHTHWILGGRRRIATDINRATHRPTLSSSTITGDVLAKLRGLKAIADGRGQSLAQMALAWVLRDPLVVSTLIGASSVTQLNENVGALANLDFSSAELAAIDEYATDANINIWQGSSEL